MNQVLDLFDFFMSQRIEYIYIYIYIYMVSSVRTRVMSFILSYQQIWTRFVMHDAAEKKWSASTTKDEKR